MLPRTVSMPPPPTRPDKENSCAAGRSLSQGFARPQTPRKTPQKWRAAPGGANRTLSPVTNQPHRQPPRPFSSPQRLARPATSPRFGGFSSPDRGSREAGRQRSTSSSYSFGARRGVSPRTPMSGGGASPRTPMSGARGASPRTPAPGAGAAPVRAPGGAPAKPALAPAGTRAATFRTPARGSPRRRASAPATPEEPSSGGVQASPLRHSYPMTPTQPRPATPSLPSTPSGTSVHQNRVRVALRIRPVSTADRGHTGQVFAVDGTSVQVNTKALTETGRESPSSLDRTFTFDHVVTGGQEQVYSAVGSPLLQDVFQGYNACLFAYGQTGSGKTHSLQGSPEDEGVIPRMIRDLFGQARSRCAHDPALNINVTLSLFEIYNEKIRDLLGKASDSPNLDIFEDVDRRVQVKGLTKHTALSPGDALDLISQGNRRRQVGPTMMNHTSSRSHLILQVTVAQTHEPCVVGLRDMESMITITDLAGSDRVSKTEAVGGTFHESKKINHSLLMLGRSLNSMSEGHTFVPSRDSKITRLLAAYLQGNCKTMVLATVSPTAFNMTESVCTMEFAQNAAAVKNTVRVNNTATRAVLMKELRLAKETAEERCVELEAKVQALLQLQDEASRRCTELEARVHDAQCLRASSPRSSMDMLTDDAPQNQTVAALESSPMEVSDPQDDGQVVAMQAQIQQLVSALSAKTEEAEAAALRAAALEQSLAALKNDFEMVCLHPIFIPYQLQDLLHTVDQTRSTLEDRMTDLECSHFGMQASHQQQLEAISSKCQCLEAERQALMAENRRLKDGLGAADGDGPRLALPPLQPVSPGLLSGASSLCGSHPTTPCRSEPSSARSDNTAALFAQSPAAESVGTPKLCARSPPADAQATPKVCARARDDDPPVESICISSDSDDEAPRLPTRRTTMVTRSCTKAREELQRRWTRGAEAAPPPEPRTALKLGDVLALEAPRRRSGGARRSSGASRRVSRSHQAISAVVVGLQSQDTYLVRVARPYGALKSEPLSQPCDHPRAPDVSAADCRYCMRRRTGYQIYAEKRRPAVKRRHSTSAAVEKEIGKQWRRLSVHVQSKYNHMADGLNQEMAVPLCRGTFNRFAAEQRTMMKSKHPTLNNTLIMRRVSAMWKTMPYRERARYSQHTPRA